MNQKLMLLVAVAVLVLGIAGLFGTKAKLEHSKAQRILSTSASKSFSTHVRGAADSWIGASVVFSLRFLENLQKKDVGLTATLDSGNAKSRLKAVEAGKLDFAVVTVRDFVRNYLETNRSSKISLIVDRSNGSDGLIAYDATLDTFRSITVNDPKPKKVGIIRDSPAEDFLMLVGLHFDIPAFNLKQHPELAQKVIVYYDSPEDALAAFKKHEIDAVDLWAPELKIAAGLQGTNVLIDSSMLKGALVDVLVFNTEFLGRNPEAAGKIARAYYDAVDFYKTATPQFVDEIRTLTNLPSDIIESSLAGCELVSGLQAASEWFWIGKADTSKLLTSSSQIVQTIQSTIRSFQKLGLLSEVDAQQLNAYEMISQIPLERAYAEEKAQLKPTDATKFAVWTEKQWKAAKELDSINRSLPKISFLPGSYDLTPEATATLEEVMETLKFYPDARIEIRGHTNDIGADAENLELSKHRADAVKSYLLLIYGDKLDENRLHSVGFGSAQLLVKLPGESMRQYRDRLQRIEIAVVYNK